MPRLLLLAALLALTSCQNPGRDVPSVLAQGVVLSEDAPTAARLDAALSGLLEELAGGELSDRWVDPAERTQNDFFYRSVLRGARGTRPLVLKSFPADGSTYALTIAFLPEGPTTDIPRIVELEATPSGAGYRFRSPFASRVARLEAHAIGSVTFRSSGPFDCARAEEFVRFKEEFESVAGEEPQPLDYYCFHTLDALLKTYGLVHDASKCNALGQDLGFLEDDARRYVTGTGDERYVFGYVRDALRHRAVDPDAFYAPYANGIAAYYGGYSLSGDSMETLAAQMRAELERRPSLDFLEEFRKGRGSSVERHFTYYVLCAFLYGEVEQRHGVQVALEGLESGADGEAFFAFLETRLGVDEAGFHDLVLDMIGTAGAGA